MRHCDPTVLSLAALGEPVEGADADHLAGCSQCRADVDDLAEVVTAVRVDVPSGPQIPPPPRVWDRIAAETGVRTAPRQELIGRVSAAPPPTVIRPRRARGAGAGGSRARRLVIAVAAAALVIGAVAGSLVTRLLTPGTTPPASVVASAQLAGLPLEPAASGSASVVRQPDGDHLVVDVRKLDALNGRFYEVWLIDRSISRMVPIGILRGSQGEFVIPTGLDRAEYPVVDISVQEPGNPAHSGRSVLRGTLPA